LYQIQRSTAEYVRRMRRDGSKGIHLRSSMVLIFTAVISVSAVATISSTTKDNPPATGG